MINQVPNVIYEHTKSSPSAHAVVLHHRPIGHNIEILRSMLMGMIVSGLVVASVNVAKLYHAPALTLQQNDTATAPTPSPAVNAVVPKPKPTKPSSRDLQKLLNSWQADYPHASFGVVVKELGGSKRSASINPDKEFFAASLYKLYEADYLYSKISNGAFNLSSVVGSSHSLGTCLQLMIVVSDNACPEAIGYELGWSNLQSFVSSQGFNETSMAPIATSANDTADFLTRLAQGSLLSSSFSDDLITNMSHQIFRSGIPAGSSGIKVADKVGFNYGYWHDAAIVYHPKGRYVLVVLTKDTGPSAIADLAARINKFMNR